jgi:hypothetical protein
MDFNKMIMPIPHDSVFELNDKSVWCGTILKKDKYYLLFSMWPKEKGHHAWVTDSEIGCAVSSSPFGPFEYQGTILSGSGEENWDADCIHNPCAIEYGGLYYLYYMANKGNGEFWNHRNNQRIGIAWAEHPSGPWHRSKTPAIDVTAGSFDSLLVSNPAVTVTPNGKILMLYKAVGDGEMPAGGRVICGVATAENPLGPFIKHNKPIFVNPLNNWSVEDPFLWFQNDRYYALVKDFQGYFTKKDKASVALFESFNGFEWNISENSFAFDLNIKWADGRKENLIKLERPQIYFENNKPVVLLCAGARDVELINSFNIQIPLRS